MEPGIYTLEQAKYLADPCEVSSLSSGIAHLLCSSSPAHAREAHPRLNPNYFEEESERFDIGTAAHAILLEGMNIVEVVYGFSDWRKKEAREKRDEIRQRGKVPLLEEQAADVVKMVIAAREQLNEHEDGRFMFRDGKPEQVLVWQDDHDVWCRARLDWLRHPIVRDVVDASRYTDIDDYKSTSATANPETVSRTLFTNGWDVQAAFYLRGLKKLTGADATFRFAVQETYPPYALSVVAPGPAALILAEKKVLYALETWSHCLNTGEWPGYPDRTCYASLPEYIENAWLRREEAGMA